MARPRSWWKIALVIAVGALGLRLACTARRGSAPDDRLAAHFAEMCKIAERGISAPEQGVRRLMRYHGDNAPEMLATLGTLLVTIERIDDDRKHDARARVARDRLRAPLRACERTWQRFGEAVEGNPAASRTLQRGVERLNRTLEIIFQGSAFADWPQVLGRRLDQMLR